MTDAGSIRSKVNLLSLLGALILFLLPWTEVRCGKERFATQTGLEAIQGGVTLEVLRDAPQEGGKPDFPAAAMISIALVVLVVATGVALIAVLPGSGARIHPGLLSGIALLLIAAQAAVGFPIDKDTRPKDSSEKAEPEATSVKRTAWFWLECAALAVPMATALSERRKSRGETSRAP